MVIQELEVVLGKVSIPISDSYSLQRRLKLENHIILGS